MRSAIRTEKAPAAIGPYSQAIRYGDLLFVSGQIPLDPATGKIVEGGIEVQTEQVLRNMQAILEAAGMGFGNVLKCTCFLADMADFPVFNSIYGKFFDKSVPAREAVQVARLPKDALVEISAICGA